MGKFDESINILKKAQQLDREVYLVEEQLKEIPELREKLKQELELEKNRLKELEESLKAVQLKQKQKEGELSQKEQNIKKLDGQLTQVKTNKEYSALQQEIASLKADNSLLEEEIIKMIDEVEAAHEEVKKEKDRLKACEKEFAAKAAEVDAKEKKIKDTITNHKKERENIVAQVDPELGQMYNVIISKKQGMALAKVVGDNCGACQIQIRPQLLNEVLMGENLTLCDNCARILYVEQEDNPATPKQ